MAYGSKATDGANLIAGRFAIDFARPLPDGGGGLAAFAVEGSLMAVQVQRGWPARARAIQNLAKAGIDNLLAPLGHGQMLLPSAEMGYFVVTGAPPGAPVSMAMQPWPEKDLIDRVLRPIAAVLSELHNQGVTHRAIRPDNLFFNSKAPPVTLGCGWAEPPGCRQPASLQPPYLAVCDPCGQGDGTIADDVYALGGVLIWLALGRDPLAGLDADAVVQRKLDVGSYAALVGANRLPPLVADLARGMLSDDPEHRISPVLLTDPFGARAHRVASRPPRRAQRPLDLAGGSVWTARAFAHSLLREPAVSLTALRDGSASQWVRRSIGDAALATRLDELVIASGPARPGEQQSEAMTVMQVVAALDPLAPMSWQGRVFWPDGFGATLCHAMVAEPGSARVAALENAAPMVELWNVTRSKRADYASNRALVRQFQRWFTLKPRDQVAKRLCYALNPLTPCASPLLRQSWIVRLAELLPAIEAAAGSGAGGRELLDQDIVAFIAARRDDAAGPGLGRALLAMGEPGPMVTLRLLAELQSGLAPAPVPNLAARLAEGSAAILSRYQSRARRTRLTERMAAIVQLGQLRAMVTILEDPEECRADEAERSSAMERIGVINHLLDGLAVSGPTIKADAHQTGHDVAAGAGMLAFGLALAAALFF